MTVEEALRLIEELCVRKNMIDPCTYRYNQITIDCWQVERGLVPCLHCGALAGMGTIAIRHDDGRTVRFSPQLFHYAEAGHPIADEDVDRDMVVALMSGG